MKVVLTIVALMLGSFTANAMNLQVQRSRTGQDVAFVLSGELFSVNTRFEVYRNGEGRSLPAIEIKDSTKIFFRSPGGNGNGPQWLLEWFTAQLERAQAKPTVYVFDVCASACVEFLTGLNALALKQRINLVVSSELAIGFHGSTVSDSFATSETPDLEQMKRLADDGSKLGRLIVEPFFKFVCLKNFEHFAHPTSVRQTAHTVKRDSRAVGFGLKAFRSGRGFT